MSFSEMTLNELLERFGSSSPTPGGGSAAALAASVGASLVAMAARLTAGKKKDRHGVGRRRPCERQGKLLFVNIRKKGGGLMPFRAN